MLPFRKILFPVDYSAPCQALIPYVSEMASRFSAELTVAHAYAPMALIANNELLITDYYYALVNDNLEAALNSVLNIADGKIRAKSNTAAVNLAKTLIKDSQNFLETH